MEDFVLLKKELKFLRVKIGKQVNFPKALILWAHHILPCYCRGFEVYIGIQAFGRFSKSPDEGTCRNFIRNWNRLENSLIYFYKAYEKYERNNTI